MLLLVTVGLVLAGLILLIVGFVQDSLTLIYLSIACAAVAGVALIVFSRLSRRQAITMAMEGVPAAAAPPSPGLVTAGVAPAQSGRTAERPAAPAAPARPPIAAREDAEPAAARFDPGAPTRPQPVGAVSREASPATARLEPVSVPAPTQAAGDLSEDDWDEDWGDEVMFPIEDYDDLRVAEIVPLLPELDPDELEEVRDREAAGKNRASILARIDELLGTAAPPAPAAKAAPAKSAAGKAAATANKAAATTKKAAATAKKAAAPAPSRKAAPPAKKAAPSQAAAASKKAAPSKAAAKKAPEKAAPAPARKAAPPAKKAAPSQAAAAKKTAPSKAAAPAKKAASKAAPAKGATRKR